MLAVMISLGLMAAACGGGTSEEEAPAPGVSTTVASPSSTASSTTTTTEPPCPPAPAEGEPVPEALRTSLSEGLVQLVSAAPGSQFTVSIRIDGHGEVLAHEPDLALAPASNQKLLTAYGALRTLDLFGGLTTTVSTTAAPDAAGALSGDLVLTAGGDPTLTTRGPHSLDALADQVVAGGLTSVSGRLLLDDRRHESTLIPPGWPDFQVPRFGGPLSVLMVDDNEGRSDAAFLADPGLEHARTFARLLSDRGLVVSGGVARLDAGGSVQAAGATVVASVESAPVGSLIGDLLLNSDNESADLLLREIGAVASGQGTLDAGGQQVQKVLAERCIDLVGGFGDGSGVSLDNRRSARELRRVVDLFLVDPLGPAVLDSLPVAAETGTLTGRFVGTSAAGVLVAKSGSIIGGKAITGLTRTADGRTATFSVLVNGPDAANATEEIDALLVRLSDPF